MYFQCYLKIYCCSKLYFTSTQTGFIPVNSDWSYSRIVYSNKSLSHVTYIYYILLQTSNINHSLTTGNKPILTTSADIVHRETHTGCACRSDSLFTQIKISYNYSKYEYG